MTKQHFETVSVTLFSSRGSSFTMTNCFRVKHLSKGRFTKIKKKSIKMKLKFQNSDFNIHFDR